MENDLEGMMLLHEDIIKRLESFGYTADETVDKWAIDFIIEKVTSTIRNECNIGTIPEGLHQIVIDMVCGEFLMMKKGSGQLSGFEVDLDSAALKQTQSGDTNVVFAVEKITSPEQRLDALIYYLMNYGKGQFVTHRQIKWT